MCQSTACMRGGLNTLELSSPPPKPGLVGTQVRSRQPRHCRRWLVNQPTT